MKDQILNQLASLESQALGEFENQATEDSLYQIKVKYLGKKGMLTDLLKDVGKLQVEERPVVGALANKIKTSLEKIYEHKLKSLRDAKIEQSLIQDALDVSLPSLRWRRGRIHPLTQTLSRMTHILKRMGFDVHEGPEIETDYYNFEALNISKDHPARDMQDTFYFSSDELLGGKPPSFNPEKNNPNFGPKGPSFSRDKLLRTHTSPVQVRVMQKQKPPIYMVAPGAVYRCDSDVTHTPMFHQIEGLVVDQNIHMGHLKGVLEHFLREIFGEKKKVRFRPSFFPFTEPSAEVDIQCVMCDGQGCRLCKQTGWIEIMGCGMVHPQVFANVGIDSDTFSGFAFGIGVERVAMLHYGINDLRLFFENDVRFLDQF